MPHGNVVQSQRVLRRGLKRLKRLLGDIIMYLLSSYVLGGIVTALALTPFVSAPDRSFVGTLLATPAPELNVSVNRTLKGDRRVPTASSAERTATAQSVVPKTIKKSDNTLPTPDAAPRLTKDAPAGKSRLLDGCESAFSEITDRQLADIPGRCVALLPVPAQMASLH